MNEVFLSLRLIRGSCRECVLTACKFGESRVGEAYDSPLLGPLLGNTTARSLAAFPTSPERMIMRCALKGRNETFRDHLFAIHLPVALACRRKTNQIMLLNKLKLELHLCSTYMFGQKVV